MPDSKTGLPASVALTLAICCGFSVAAIYYNQTMLPLIAATFGISGAHVGQIAMLTWNSVNDNDPAERWLRS